MGWISGIGLVLVSVGFAVWSGVWRGGVLAIIQRVGAGLICVLFGGLWVLLGLTLRSFDTFTRTSRVAQAECRRIGPQAFELVYVSFKNEQPQDPKTFRLTGDQWAISGGVVTWRPWLTVLGLPSYHKPTRLSGRFANTAEEISHPPSAFDLNGGTDVLWQWLYEASAWLPVIEAAYGSSAFVPAQPGWRYDVLISHSGYLIHRVRPDTRTPRENAVQ